MKRIIFIIIVIAVICYFQYTYINEISESLEILQYENPKKNIFENIVQEKLISVFTSIHFNWVDNLNLNQQIINNLYYYNIPLAIDYNHTIINEPINATQLIKKQNKYRRLFYIYKGIKRYFIFTPNQSNYLYLNNDISPINLWNQNIEKYPLITHSKYIEIICRENTMLYIPYGYYFTCISEEDSVTIDLYSESIFSAVLKK
jgi:hypothetical protein